MRIKVGIQGDRGSTNERAALLFKKQFDWKDLELLYLISSENVLSALHRRVIDYGTFAWSSSRHGLVTETQEAIAKYPFEKVSELTLELDHALFSSQPTPKEEIRYIYSHPQALAEHASFLKEAFPHAQLLNEIDTAVAAKKLTQGEYPKNSLVIAPEACEKIYDLYPFQKALPTNKGYEVTIFLVK